MKKNINSIVIEGKRWFDKINGNTYHSVNVYVNGKFIGGVPYEYGYGDQYIQTAHTILQETGFYPISNKKNRYLQSGAQRDYYNFTQDMRNHRNKFVVTIADVGRKKDL